MSDPNPPPRRDVYSVSRLNAAVRDLLEGSFPVVWVAGEVSNLSRPASGHLYFTLKDTGGQIRCALFRTQARLLARPPSDGQQVLVRATVSLYPARGDFQLIVEYLEDYGEGALRRAFDALKAKLAAEGLFAEASKRPLPPWPRRVGLITSPSGAAVHDVLTVLRRRFPGIPVLIHPVPVQGPEAAPQIVAALELAAARADCDVLILARGGGSLEDLQPFNTEAVARALRACPIPVVTGVGHEVDVTIADFAADWRAATPSAAAERVSPDQAAWRARLDQVEGRLRGLATSRVQQDRRRLQDLRARLRHPRQQLRDRSQRIDGLALRLGMAIRQVLQRHQAGLGEQARSLRHHTPLTAVTGYRLRLQHAGERLASALEQRLAERQGQLATLARALDAVSPLATLERGYALVLAPAGTRLIRSVHQTAPGEALRVRLTDGTLDCRVEACLEGGRPTAPGATPAARRG